MHANVIKLVRPTWVERNAAGRADAEQFIADLQAERACPSSLRNRIPKEAGHQVGFLQRIAEGLLG